MARGGPGQPVPGYAGRRSTTSRLYALFLAVPYDLETTRVHSWNVGVQHQLGDNMGVSASRYLGNHMIERLGRRRPAIRASCLAGLRLADQPVHAAEAGRARRDADVPELLDRRRLMCGVS